MKRSIVDSNKTISPFKSPDQDTHNRSYEFNKSRYTEVTIQTFDKDVPFIAIYKPDVSIQRKRVQAATKIVTSLLNMQKVRAIYAMNRVIGMGPKQKAMRIKALYLRCLFEKIAKVRKERAMKGLVVNKIKKNNGLVSAKIVCKIQNSILSRNYKATLSELRRNRLINIIREISDSNELATELKRNREEIAQRKQESFSEGFVEKCRKLQKNINRENFIEVLTQENFAGEAKKEIKKFEDIRYSRLPRRKEPLENESVAAAIFNIIQHYESSLKEYEKYCQQLQTQVAGYKDAQGLQQLKQTITEKDNTIRDFQVFVNELARLDTQLKKFTIENKFMAEKLASTLNAHDKKLEQRAKNLQGSNSKVLVSRMYLTGVISILVKKYEQAQRQVKEYRSRESEYQLINSESLNSLQTQIANMKSQIEQEKARVLAFYEKKDNKSGLLDLKRKWRTTNDQLKSLVDYVASLHQQIEKLNHQKSQSSKSIEKTKVQQPKKFERERSTRDEKEMAKKMQLQQREAQRMERQFHNKSKSLQKEKLDLTRKLQKEQSDISRIKKELDNITKQLETERLQASRKDQELQNSVGKLSQYIKKTFDCTNQGTSVQPSTIPEITGSLGPILPQVQQLVDLVCRLKNGKQNQQAEKHSIYEQSFVESDVKVYKPEINMDEFEKEIAHRLFSHLQSELQSKKSEISKNRKSDTKYQDSTTIALISEVNHKIEMLQQKLTAKSRTDELVSKSITQIAELESTVKQLEKAITQLNANNQTLLLKIEQLKLYYQQQIGIVQSQFKDTASFIANQYSEKIDGFTTQQSSNARLVSQKNQLIFSKQLQIQEDINNLRTQIMCNISENNFRSIDSLKTSQDSNILRLKITEFEAELSRRTHQKERTQNRLKQTEQSLENQRQKITGLQADLAKMQQQIDRSHSEADKLAMETHDQIKTITKVLRALEQELDKKTRLAQSYQNKSASQQKTIVKLESQLYNSQQQLQESIRHSSMMQQRNMQLSGELNHLKNQFFSIQVELQSNRSNKNYASSQLSSLQNEIRQKQGAINNILEQSKANSTTLNHQLFEAREQLVHQERRFEEQLTLKSALINRLEHQLIEHQSTIRTLEQKCIFLQQSSRRVQQQTKHDSYDIKDREIELLRQQIATLQQFLADISHQYKQLQIKYHQQKLKFGGTPIQKLHNHQLEQSMEVIDKAIHELSENAPFSQEVKSLIYNNEKLQINIEELQRERLKLLEKTKKLPQREYVVQLVFNVLLGAHGVSRQSAKANGLWSQLMKINQESGEVEELLGQLQKFSLGQLARRQ